MSIFHPASVPAWFKIHTDDQANRDNWAAVRLALTLVPAALTGVALTIGLTYGGAGIPADPAHTHPASVMAVCDTDSDCAAHDAGVAARSGVAVILDPSEPWRTPSVDVTPDGGVRLYCGGDLTLTGTPVECVRVTRT